MALFERKIEDKILIDDTKTLVSQFKETINVGGHVEYSIEVCRQPDFEEKWTVKHRYSDFTCLNSALKTPTIILPNLPAKKVFGNTNKDFINDRKTSLQLYINELLEIPFVSCSPQVRKFLDPTNYEGKHLEEAQQNLLIALRSGGSYEVSQTLPNIGTRLRKHYFLGHPLSNAKAQHVLWWAPYGPDRSMQLRDNHATLTALLQCQHPYIVSAVSCVATESGICVIRPWFPQGSLRDFIYGVKPQFDFLLKYTNNKRRAIPIKTCAVYGRQILEAIVFLHEKGIAHGALHTGNVVIENNVCQLLDIENQVVGLPHPLRPRMINIKKINTLEAIDIYCFGHILYEMIFHNPLLSETCDSFPSEVSPLCRSVLESILSAEACKNGLPSASGLLTHPFFNEVPLYSYVRPSLKLSSGIKLALNTAYKALLQRLKDDQKKLKLQRQKFRAEAILSGQSGQLKIKKANNERSNGSSSTPESDSAVNSSAIAAASDPGCVPGNSTGEEIKTNSSQHSSSVCDLPQNGDSSKLENSSYLPGRNELLSSISNFDKNNLKKRMIT